MFGGGLAAWSVRGTCRDSDPIPDCANDTAQAIAYLSLPVAIVLAIVAAAIGLVASAQHRRGGAVARPPGRSGHPR